VYNDSFPKLGCIAPNFDKGLLDMHLKYLRGAVESAKNDGPNIITSTSSQFTLTDRREILTRNIEAFLPALMEKYLTRRGGSSDRQRGNDHVQTKLEDLLVSRFEIPSDFMLRQPAPGDYLGPQVLRKLRAKDFKPTRVVNSKTHLLTIDAIDLSVRQNLETRSFKIAYGLNQLGSVKGDLEEFEGKELVRAAIFLGSAKDINDSHFDFARDTLRVNSEMVFESEAVPPTKFLEISRTIVRSQSLPIHPH